MELQLKLGDLFATEADAIGQGTNTHGKMGAGIAVLFKRKHPQMFERYAALCDAFGDKLGGRTHLYFSDDEADGYRYIANIFSQKKPGANAETRLLVSGVRDAFIKLYGDEEIDAPHLAIPLIGCGIGGLDWVEDVYPALQELAQQLPADWKLTVVSNEPRDGFH